MSSFARWFTFSLRRQDLQLVDRLADQIARETLTSLLECMAFDTESEDEAQRRGYLRAYAAAVVRNRVGGAAVPEGIRQRVIETATQRAVDLAIAELARQAAEPRKLAAAA